MLNGEGVKCSQMNLNHGVTMRRYYRKTSSGLFENHPQLNPRVALQNLIDTTDNLSITFKVF